MALREVQRKIEEGLDSRGGGRLLDGEAVMQELRELSAARRSGAKGSEVKRRYKADSAGAIRPSFIWEFIATRQYSHGRRPSWRSGWKRPSGCWLAFQDGPQTRGRPHQ